MPLEIANTVLRASPYFDDFEPSKNFHRVLFRPAVAVQARELTQLQSILQNQIERFGNHIFKDGSVVQGCAVEYIPDLEYVGVEDQFSDDADLSVEDAQLIGAVAVGQTSDVQALVVSTRAGFIRQKPGRLYVRYTKPGISNARTFTPGEEIRLYGEDTSYVENILISVANAAIFSSSISLTLDAVQTSNTANVLARAILVEANTATNTLVVNNVRRRFTSNTTIVLSGDLTVNATITAVNYQLSNEIGRINVLTSNTDSITIANNDIEGFSYGAHVSDGVIYHKGIFISVKPHNVIVNQESNNPSGYLLGFVTAESVVTETSDDSLYDNALGYSNFNASGAHRLKLTSTVVSRAANSISNTEIFFPIVEFSNTGVAFERTDPQYAALGDEIAKRTFEESGHYIVKPFGVSSNTNPEDANSLIYDLSPGLAYVKGFRQELLTNLPIKGRRGTNTVSYSEQIVSMSFGNYAEVKEVRGYFPTDSAISVSLYDTVQVAVTGAKTPDSAIVGTLIGTANLREITAGPGTPGDANTVDRFYLFNVVMTSNAVSFAFDAKSIVYGPNATHRAFADIAVANVGLSESSFAPALFSLGAKAVKTLKDANNVSDSNFYYNAANTTASLESAGTINFRVPSGGGILGFTDGSDTSESRIDLVLRTEAISSNVSTTAVLVSNSSGNFVTDAGISAKVLAGEGVRHGSNTYLVLQNVNANTLRVSNTVVANTDQTITRYHYAGSHVSLNTAGRTVAINANNEATINLGYTYTNAPVDARLRFYALQNQGAEVKKIVNRNTAVLVQVANTGTDVGPWNLGVPDVFRVSGVFLAANTGANTAADLETNYLDQFALDNGQRDTHYDHATLRIKAGFKASTFANTRLLVTFDHFTANNTTGKGFFSVDSYPVDDGVSANTNATIATAEIPTFYSATLAKQFDLRDTIDFRPYKTATATITSNLRTASLSPATSNLFNAQTTTFKPYPGQNFECNFTHYLGRKDVLTITPAGGFVVVEGVAALNTRTPSYPSESLVIANIEVPPFPSLPDNERAFFQRPEYAIKVSVQNNKRFTMKDISSIEQRVSRLEYYTSLNALEKAAADLKVTSNAGLDRFKNGIFVDPMNNHSFGRVDLPQYKVAMDETKGFARPFFQPEFFELEYELASSPGTRKSGDMVTMDFNEELFLSQQYATDSRKLSGAPPTYVGTLLLTPNRWSDIEVYANPVSVNTSDRSSQAYREMSAPALCSQYGWWRTDKLASVIDAVLTESSSAVETLRDKTKLTAESTYSLNDNVSQSTTIQSFIRARELAFRAYGLKPYTDYYLYIDDVESSELTAPGDIDLSSDLTDERAVVRTAIWGTQLQSNSRGELAGKLTIPGFRYKVGRHTVKLLSQRIDVVTKTQISSAAALFEADVIYRAPPPPIVVVIVPQLPPALNPPLIAPSSPNPPASPPSAPTPPIAKFTKTGELYRTSPQNHVITFVNASVAGSGTITNWAWDFGDGTTHTGQTPPPKTYIITQSSVTQIVKLTVTDSNGLTATYIEPITLYKLPAAPPVVPAAPPTPSATLIVTSYTGASVDNFSFINGAVVGSGVVEGAGRAASYHIAVPTTTYAGAFYDWTVTVNSGDPLTNTVEGGTANNRLDIVLLDPTSSNTPLESVTTLQVDYKYANNFIIGTKTLPFTLRTKNVVVPIAPPSGGGGCVASDSYLTTDGLLAYDVVIGTKVDGYSEVTGKLSKMKVNDRQPPMWRDSVRLVTESGATLRCSKDTPFTLKGTGTDAYADAVNSTEMLGELVLVDRNGVVEWERVVRLDELGSIEVIRLNVNDRSFAAGDVPHVRIYSHNVARNGHNEFAPYKKL